MTHSGARLAGQFLAREGLVSAVVTATMLAAAASVAALAAGVWGVVFGALLVVGQVIASGSGEWALRLHRAQRLGRTEAPDLLARVEKLSRRAGVPPPDLYLIPTATLNAFATETSRGSGALGLSAGLLRHLAGDELEAVIAHEIGHLAAADTRRSRWTAATANAATTLLRMSVWVGLFATLVSGRGHGMWLLLLALSWVMPVLFGLLQAALSRSREFAADTLAVHLTGRPLALAAALARLHHANTPWLSRVLGVRATAPSWLDSHPGTQQRIARLRALASSGRTPTSGALALRTATPPSMRRQAQKFAR